MHRFFSPPDRCSSSVFSLSESEARHASQVLRLGPGDHLEILDGQGGLIEAEILAASRKSVEVQVVRRQTVARPNSGVVLLQALLKGKALETVLEKSVELGVEQLVLLETDHCVAQVPPAEAARTNPHRGRQAITQPMAARIARAHVPGTGVPAVVRFQRSPTLRCVAGAGRSNVGSGAAFDRDTHTFPPTCRGHRTRG